MKHTLQEFDVIIIGAGAAGLMCAIEAGKRGQKTLIVDHANKVGKKILMSGGGRCNFTNYHIHPSCYISHNPHFCKSALSRYTQWDFIELVKKHNIPFHEKIHGQLFCDHKSKDIVNMLLSECEQHKVTIHLNESVDSIEKKETGFVLKSNMQPYHCASLVIASGGLSIPTLGSSPFGYKVAEQFGINVYPTRAGLVPFTLLPEDKQKYSPLSGVSVAVQVTSEHNEFKENLLFTHRGLSGPAILQISSYWQPGEEIVINYLPNLNLKQEIEIQKQTKPKQQLSTFLSALLPSRLVPILLPESLLKKPLNQLQMHDLSQIIKQCCAATIKPCGTEGYRTAEVTLGGIDCHAISSKTFESNQVKGLYFIGEVLDVTGWLGGYNFQWAWSSGWAAGQVV